MACGRRENLCRGAIFTCNKMCSARHTEDSMFCTTPAERTAGYSGGNKTLAPDSAAASEQHFTVLPYNCGCTLDLSTVVRYAVR